MTRQVPTAWAGILMAAWLGLSGAAVGCGLLTADEDDGARPACESAQDCPDDQICRTGWCSVADASVDRYDFLFSPPEASDYVTQFVTEVEMTPGEPTGFALEEGVTVDGRIQYSGSEQLGPESGTLVIRHRGSPGELLDYQVPVRRGQFSTLVLPGRWDLSFVPDDPSQNPGRVWTDRTFNSNTQLNLTLPRPENLDTIEGSISFRSGVADTERKWVVGARVLAVSRDGTQTSTVDTTDEKGRYEIGVIPGEKRYDLHVRPASGEQYYPRAVFEDVFSAHLDPQSTNVSKSMGNFVDQPLRATFNLAASESLPDSFEWAGTKIEVDAKIGKGTFSRTTTVREGKAAEMDLLPAPYRVRVVPPPGAPVAADTFEFNLVETMGPKTLTLDKKTKVTGRVVDSRGHPGGGVRLQFTRRNESGADGASSPSPRPISRTTESDGSFDVWLDDSPYRVVAEPPGDSGQPIGHFTVAPGDFEDASLQLELPAPVVAAGTVLGRGSDDVEPVAHTRVTVYRTVAGTRTVVGRAETDEDGEFVVLLPAKNE